MYILGFVQIFAFLCVCLSVKAAGSSNGAPAFSCPLIEPVSIDSSHPRYATKPDVNGAKTFIGGKISDWHGPVEAVTSPIIDATTGKRAVIGNLAMMGKEEALEALNAAQKAWNGGRGEWPQMTAQQRIAALEKVVISLKERREEIINVLTWEICKSVEDATSEFDRTMIFIDASIAAYKNMDVTSGGWKIVSGIKAFVRRAAIGIVMCLGPFNYPFNETYATLIPSLLAGNVVIMKLPSLGGLAHMLTMEAYAKHLPPGVLNFISGSGRVTMSPIMKTGLIDVLAFIGGSKAADAVISDHPHPHRLKLFLQLEGKNLGVVMPDANIDVAAEQVTVGALSYNGQRCTAIKLVFVHESIVEPFLSKLKSNVKNLKSGLPFLENVNITPLPETKKPAYLEELIADAMAHGATVINAEDGGGSLAGNLFMPAIVYPVTKETRLWHEEQFGPVVPVATYSNIEEVYEYLRVTPFAQQAAIFSKSAESAAPLVDVLSTIVGRININTQCGRSPDVFPFSGRRSSAMGTMSITESLNTFSVETVVAAKSNADNEKVLMGLENTSHFLKRLCGDEIKCDSK